MKRFSQILRWTSLRWSVLAAAASFALIVTWAPATHAQEGREGRPDGERRRREEREERREERKAAASTSSTTTASTANSFGTVSEGERIRQRASQMIKDHDKSGNGILEGDELEKLGMSRRADKDGDGVITRDDLITLYSPKTSTAGPPQPATTQPANASSASTEGKPDDKLRRKIVNDKRKSYRFKSTKDRANNWKFSSRDANGDGQVSMSEYTRSWSDRTAAEFLRYDKDNDGMITADEAK